MLGELRAALFAPFVAYPPCESCRADTCDEPHALTPKAEFVRTPAPPVGSITWPACPRRFESRYAVGFEQLGLDEVLAWGYELGLHRRPHLPAGLAWLFREWLRLRGLPAEYARLRALGAA